MIRKPEGRLQRGENARIFSQMRRYFAPASVVPAPGSTSSLTGNRNTVLTANNSANSTPTDSAQIQLQAGVLTWYFKTKFTSAPNVTATALTGTIGTPQELFVNNQGSTVAVVVKSTSTSDTRIINLQAVGKPS